MYAADVSITAPNPEAKSSKSPDLSVIGHISSPVRRERVYQLVKDKSFQIRKVLLEYAERHNSGPVNWVMSFTKLPQETKVLHLPTEGAASCAHRSGEQLYGFSVTKPQLNKKEMP
ncbi:hypothetical protein TNCV_2728641 [Trichonephila clavipes]|nr:hypothetical protein TNCV_2728641 [Trichonephila clavipes]